MSSRYSRQNSRIALAALLAMFSLSCNLLNLGATNPADPQATATLPLPDAAPATVVWWDIMLGAEQPVSGGGFSYRTVPGYSVETGNDYVFLEAPGGDAAFSPYFWISGEANPEGYSLDDFLAEKLARLDLEASLPLETSLDGRRALMVELGQGADQAAFPVGRMVVAEVTPTWVFTLLVIAPDSLWDAEIEPLCSALLASVRLFEPAGTSGIELPGEGYEVPTETYEIPTLEPLPTLGSYAPAELRQWASEAFASSSAADLGWTAFQATGEPDTFECGDIPTAWAPASQDGVEWIELTYVTPVIPMEVRIYQSYNPSQVVQVELFDVYGYAHTIFTGQAAGVDECPFVLSLTVTDLPFAVDRVRITIDQSSFYSRNEIDAVELVGFVDGEG